MKDRSCRNNAKCHLSVNVNAIKFVLLKLNSYLCRRVVFLLIIFNLCLYESNKPNHYDRSNTSLLELHAKELLS